MLEKILCEKLDGVEMEMREDEDDSSGHALGKNKSCKKGIFPSL